MILTLSGFERSVKMYALSKKFILKTKIAIKTPSTKKTKKVAKIIIAVIPNFPAGLSSDKIPCFK